MDEKDWKRAINCTKEQLIEWLNEMYKDEKSLKFIIRQYEDNYNVGIESEQRFFDDPVTREQKFKYYYKVKAKNFEYIKNWR